MLGSAARPPRAAPAREVARRADPQDIRIAGLEAKCVPLVSPKAAGDDHAASRGCRGFTRRHERGCNDGLQAWAFGQRPNALLQRRREVVKPPPATCVLLLLLSRSRHGVAALLFGRVCLFFSTRSVAAMRASVLKGRGRPGAVAAAISGSGTSGGSWHRPLFTGSL